MSKISLEPNDSGAGTFSIVSPDSNTNRTLTLPDEAGTILSDVSTNIPGSGIVGQLALSNMPAGSILQFKSEEYVSRFTSTADDFVDTFIQATITPISSTSKIYISVSTHVGVEDPTFNFRRVDISRNGTRIGPDAWIIRFGFTDNAGSDVIHQNYSTVDNPQTTNSLTYKLVANPLSQGLSIGGRLRNDGADSPSIITLMEIAG